MTRGKGRKRLQITTDHSKENEPNIDIELEDYDLFLNILAEALAQTFLDPESSSRFFHNLTGIALVRTEEKSRACVNCCGNSSQAF